MPWQAKGEPLHPSKTNRKEGRQHSHVSRHTRASKEHLTRNITLENELPRTSTEKDRHHHNRMENSTSPPSVARRRFGDQLNDEDMVVLPDPAGLSWGARLVPEAKKAPVEEENEDWARWWGRSRKSWQNSNGGSEWELLADTLQKAVTSLTYEEWLSESLETYYKGLNEGKKSLTRPKVSEPAPSLSPLLLQRELKARKEEMEEGRLSLEGNEAALWSSLSSQADWWGNWGLPGEKLQAKIRKEHQQSEILPNECGPEPRESMTQSYFQLFNQGSVTKSPPWVPLKRDEEHPNYLLWCTSHRAKNEKSKRGNEEVSSLEKEPDAYVVKVNDVVLKTLEEEVELAKLAVLKWVPVEYRLSDENEETER